MKNNTSLLLIIAFMWVAFLMWQASLPSGSRLLKVKKKKARRLCKMHASAYLKPKQLALIDPTRCEICLDRKKSS